MDADSPQQAWLVEGLTGHKTLIDGTCYIGRSSSNTIVLPEEKVSRRHAMIHLQSDNEYWMVDLGSSNGSYLNGRRLVQPGRLRDGDRIEIGGKQFHFSLMSKEAETQTGEHLDSEKTIQDIKSQMCWLLIADIQGSTEFVKKLAPEEAPKVTGLWLNNCRRIIEKQHGSINKFLGDGFFAFWPDKEGVVLRVKEALDALRELQVREEPRFRMVLHFGRVFLGSQASLGEESLMGNEVNFVFRMEKVAASMGASSLLSEAAGQKLAALMDLVEEGTKPVPSFEGEFLFYSAPRHPST